MNRLKALAESTGGGWQAWGEARSTADAMLASIKARMSVVLELGALADHDLRLVEEGVANPLELAWTQTTYGTVSLRPGSLPQTPLSKAVRRVKLQHP